MAGVKSFIAARGANNRTAAENKHGSIDRGYTWNLRGLLPAISNVVWALKTF